MKKKLSHTAKILMKLIKGETLISSDVFASNTNQYFGHIKDQGIELIEWNEPTEGRHLKRKLNLTDENIERAKKYLCKLMGKSYEAQG
jgi:tRNA A37 threonylcarbamoyladenosine biosynthesis protein TsaE